MITTEGELSATAYLISQASLISDLEFAYGEYRTYQVSVASIVALTGLGFDALVPHDPLDTESLVSRQLADFADIADIADIIL